ncbi:MAG: glycoside hydrolase family 3 N-terminal domain-containing protein [Pseudomonadota bacterium]
MSIDRRHFMAGAGALSLTQAFAATPAQALLRRSASGVPLEKMIGQMLMMGFVGKSADDSWSRTLARQISEGTVGGVVFLRHNVESQSGVKSMTRAMNAAGKNSITPFLALDHEGGAVQRLSAKKGYTKLPSARDVAKSRNPDSAKSLYRTAAREIASAGFNYNLAPVVDLEVNPKNPVIAKWGRSFGRDPQTVTAYAGAFVDAHREVKIVTSIKHFPGHGSSAGDSHDGFVDVTGRWSETEVEPFRALVASGRAKSVMTGHLFHGSMSDGGTAPVTFSQKAVDGFLRKTLNYDGVVMTDDMDMGAIRQRYPLEEAMVRGIQAGHDIVMMSNSAKPDPAFPERAIAVIKQAIADGRLNEERIAQSYQRIVTLKARYIA